MVYATSMSSMPQCCRHTTVPDTDSNPVLGKWQSGLERKWQETARKKRDMLHGRYRPSLQSTQVTYSVYFRQGKGIRQ